MENLEEFTRTELRERGIEYLAQDCECLIYKDKDRIYYFKPINIIKNNNSPFHNSNNCERYQLISKYKLEE